MMKHYDSYKESGIEWIGEIPSHWILMKFGYLFHEKSSTNNLSLRTGSISFGNVVYKDDESIPLERKETYQELLKGEFLVNPLNLNYDLKSLRIGLSDIDVVVSPGYIVLQLRGGNNKYFSYLLRTFDTQHMKSLGNGIRQTISFKHLSTEYIPLPPLSEQEHIVSYLDDKTTKIDDLIQKKLRKIDLLKEYRTSLINTVVTKGLNPNVPMKDSGLNWIGEIPSHWEVKELKHLGSFQNGISKSSEYFGKGFPFMNYGDVYNNEVTPISVEGKVESNESERIQYSVIRGDVFFTRTSESKDDIGVSSTCLRTIDESVFSGFVIRFRFINEQHTPEYSRYHFQTHWKKVFIESKMNIVTRSSLSQQVLGKVPVLIPPLSEQEHILSYLDEKTSQIDKTIDIEKKKIELLKEYRQSLISNVVTGKIKVIE